MRMTPMYGSLVVAVVLSTIALGCDFRDHPTRLVHGEIIAECIDSSDDDDKTLTVIVTADESVFQYDNKVEVLVERPDEPSPGNLPNRLVVNYHFPGGGMRGCGGVGTETATFRITENAAENVIIQILAREPVWFSLVRDTGEPFFGPIRIRPDNQALISWPREFQEEATQHDG
jgi:hypothetical protein